MSEPGIVAGNLTQWIVAASLLGGAVIGVAGAWPHARSVLRRAVLIAASVGLSFSLWALMWPPRVAATTEVILLTDGADAQARRRAARSARAYALAREVAPGRVRAVADLAALARAEPAAERITVLGDGVAATDWAQAPAWRVTHAGMDDTLPVASARWPASVAPGEALTVHVRLGQGVAVDSLAVLLDPFGVPVDEAPAGARASVSLRAIARAPGLYVFRWQLRDAQGGALRDEPVPVAVRAPTPPHVFVLLAAPSFESRFLLDWVRDSGARVASSVQLSRGRYRDGFSELPERRLRPVDATVLNGVDLTIADARTWQALTADERAAVAEAVGRAGMGVLLFGDPQVLPASAAGGLPGAGEAVTVRRADGVAAGDVATLGRGRIGVARFGAAHATALTDDAQRFAQRYRALTDATARRAQGYVLDAPARRARPDRVVQVCGWGLDASPRVFDLEAPDGTATELATGPHPARPGQQCAHFWPTEPGWHTLRAGSAVRDVYVHADGDWQDLARRARRDATALAVQAGEGAPTTNGAAPVPLPRWWFFLLAVAMAGMLWIEQKLRT